jgi:NTP pyrophosphatase (non-canonical NTP hydrolase)
MKEENELLALYDDCMAFWGLERQLRMTQEECGELIIAISHFIRGREDGLEDLVEELADTQLMINQIIHHVGEGKVKSIIDIKSDYVKRKLEEAKEEKDGI